MIEIAKGAGFCFGVKRAVEKVEFLLKKGVRVCTLGELIRPVLRKAEAKRSARC